MKERNAFGRIFRGFSVSAATEEMYSGPQILDSCQIRKRRKLEGGGGLTQM